MHFDTSEWPMLYRRLQEDAAKGNCWADYLLLENRDDYPAVFYLVEHGQPEEPFAKHCDAVLDLLYATCIVFADENDNALALCTADLCHVSGRVWPAVVEQASAQWGISRDASILAATHTISLPTISGISIQSLV